MAAATCSMSARPRTSRSASRLCAADRPRYPHRAHDRADPHAGIRRHPHRDRGAAARSQPDQAAAAALQRHAARRQIVSLYPDHLGSLGAANPETSRRALAAGPVLRPVRLGVGGQPHRQRLAARVSVALVQRSVLRKPHPAVFALSDQALLGAVHQGDRVPRLCGAGARGQCVPVRPQQDGQGPARRGHGESVHGARLRARRDLSRPSRGAVGDPIAAGHQSAHRRGGRRLCRASAGRLHLRRSVLLPHRAELGQPRLFSQGRQIARAGRSAVGVPGAVLRRQAAAAPDPDLARHRGPRRCSPRRSPPRAATRSKSRCRSAARRRI